MQNSIKLLPSLSPCQPTWAMNPPAGCYCLQPPSLYTTVSLSLEADICFSIPRRALKRLSLSNIKFQLWPTVWQRYFDSTSHTDVLGTNINTSLHITESESLDVRIIIECQAKVFFLVKTDPCGNHVLKICNTNCGLWQASTNGIYYYLWMNLSACLSVCPIYCRIHAAWSVLAKRYNSVIQGAKSVKNFKQKRTSTCLWEDIQLKPTIISNKLLIKMVLVWY